MARARFAIDPTQDTNGAESQSESDLIKHFTSQAREKYAAHPELLPKVGLPADIQEMVETKMHIGAALEESYDLLYEARAQLAAPKVAPEELAPDEVVGFQREEEWDRMHREADTLTDAWLGRNDEMFKGAMRSIDECQIKGIRIPDDLTVPQPPPTPTLEQMKIPDAIAAWIAKSKKYLPPPSPPPPPGSSKAVEALKKINTTAAAAPSSKGPPVNAKGGPESVVLDASLTGTLKSGEDLDQDLGRPLKSRQIEKRHGKEFVTVCSWDFGMSW